MCKVVFCGGIEEKKLRLLPVASLVYTKIGINKKIQTYRKTNLGASVFGYWKYVFKWHKISNLANSPQMENEHLHKTSYLQMSHDSDLSAKHY